MPISISETAAKGAVESEIREQARALGFDAVGIAPAEGDDGTARRLSEFLGRGWHGDMDWLARRAEWRRAPRALWPEARSAIVLGMNYGPEDDPMAALARRDRGAISCYAQGRDYHDVVKPRLKALGRWLVERHGGKVKVFVDTAPVLEKPLAARAGLGWQGKHTNLLARGHGSWLFLGSVLTTLSLEPDAPAADRCGTCRACLEICPTNAFPAPYQLDARRCISYLTIEHKGHIPRGLRPLMGNRIYGCDDCLAVCPWNKFARAGHEALAARAENRAPPLGALAALDDAAFRRRFAGTPIKRTGRDRFVRNVLIAIGNSGERALVPAARARLDDRSPLVRAMAVWALGRLLDAAEFAALARARPADADPAVAAEWRAALD